MKVRKIIGLLTLVPMLMYGQYNRPGSTDAQFLKIGVSPRATALGDAYIAVVNGAEGTYYNAAALPWVKGTVKKVVRISISSKKRSRLPEGSCTRNARAPSGPVSIAPMPRQPDVAALP